jgi:hypothetical protein
MANFDYSDESFERFQDLLRPRVSEDDLIWILRDVIFMLLFFDHNASRWGRIPGKWLFGLLREWVGYQKIKSNVGSLPEVRSLFLFLSPRDNHFFVLYPAFSENIRSGGSAVGVVFGRKIEAMFSAGDPVFNASACWVAGAKYKHVKELVALMSRLRKLLPEFSLNITFQRFFPYFIHFFGWRDYWERQLPDQCGEIFSTFEKDSATKALFWAAKEKGVPRRVHWLHGLRNANLQATLATEMYCLTQGDVAYFSTRVPSWCKVSKRNNPFIERTAQQIRNESAKIKHAGIHFLFLSQGVISSYTEAMRLADLQILAAAQNLLPAGFFRLRVRRHPGEKLDLLVQTLQSAGVVVDEFSSGGMVDDLIWADVVGASWSTGLLEAYAAGRTVVWVQGEARDLGAVSELIADGVGCRVSPACLVGILQEMGRKKKVSKVV